MTILAFVIGGLSAAGLYLMLQRDAIRLVIGLAALNHAVNLLIFTTGGLTRAQPPLIPQGASQPIGAIANPLPQALILTAIVIGFGLQVFTLVLVYRALRTLETDDLDQMTTTDA